MHDFFLYTFISEGKSRGELNICMDQIMAVVPDHAPCTIRLLKS